MVHGDDYLCTGDESQLLWLESSLKSRYEIKSVMLGGGKDDEQEMRVSNRIITWTPQGIAYEPDQRHVEIILNELALENAKPVNTPWCTETQAREEDNTSLEGSEATKFRSIIARANYLAMDRPDIQFTVKEISRNMAKPNKGCWGKLKRLGRYLKGRGRLRWMFKWQDEDDRLKVFSDSDWARCKATRRSTVAGVI